MKPEPPAAGFPRPGRPDAGTILVSEWLTKTPRRQQAAADALLDEWRGFGTEPPEGFLSLTVFRSTDGTRLLNYAQWTDDDAHRAFMRRERPALVGGVDEAVPGIQRPGVVRLRLHGGGRQPADERTPGCLVAVRVRTKSAEAGLHWADGVLGALGATPAGAGWIGSWLHLSTDGTQALDYGEWENERAHHEASTTPVGDARRAVGETGGISPLDTRCYTPYGTVEATSGGD